MNDGRHLIIVYSTETFLKATLIDARSGTEVKSATTLSEPELANLKHIQLIDDYVITVTSNENHAVIKKRNWKKFLCNQSKKKQLEDWRPEKWQVKGILLHRNFDFNNFDFDNFNLNEKSDTNNDNDADCFFLFWKNNDETKCLVWMRDNDKLSAEIKFDVDENDTLRLYHGEHENEEFYTFLPLCSVIEGNNLPAEWMQSSCSYLNYLRQRKQELLPKKRRRTMIATFNKIQMVA